MATVKIAVVLIGFMVPLLQSELSLEWTTGTTYQKYAEFFVYAVYNTFVGIDFSSYYKHLLLSGLFCQNIPCTKNMHARLDPYNVSFTD